uniref:Putative ixodes 10 kDa peptide protein n=1 Tax=Ixodes ricinus TaxID=34613 RepID=A0A0K8R449_IXORI
MQLQVFAVLLILPALQREGFLSGIELQEDCKDIIERFGDMSCGLEGFGNLEGIDPIFCTLECTGNGRPKLPKGVCSDGDLNCTRFAREDLRNWGQGLQTRLNNVLKTWCPYYSNK